MHVRNPFNYDRNEASRRSGVDCSLAVNMAKQEFKDECDINTICKQFGLGYEVPRGLRIPTYGDFDMVNDFHSAANAMAAAHESFDALPAHLRERFQNDTGKFVDFCSDPQNRSELVNMGILQEPEIRDRSGRMLPPEMQTPGNAPESWLRGARNASDVPGDRESAVAAGNEPSASEAASRPPTSPSPPTAKQQKR